MQNKEKLHLDPSTITFFTTCFENYKLWHIKYERLAMCILNWDLTIKIMSCSLSFVHFNDQILAERAQWFLGNQRVGYVIDILDTTLQKRW